jgi:hypothetical protein
MHPILIGDATAASGDARAASDVDAVPRAVSSAADAAALTAAIELPTANATPAADVAHIHAGDRGEWDLHLCQDQGCIQHLPTAVAPAAEKPRVVVPSAAEAAAMPAAIALPTANATPAADVAHRRISVCQIIYPDTTTIHTVHIAHTVHTVHTVNTATLWYKRKKTL